MGLMGTQMPNVMEVKVEQQQQPDTFMQKRVEIMIDMATKKLVAEILRLSGDVQRLDREMNDMRKKVSSASITPVQGASNIPSGQPAQPQRSADFSPERKVSADMPRYGHYTSNDVSIEKFFNFGSGRRK